MSISCSACHHLNRDAVQSCAGCGAPLLLAARFRVLRKIGQGGMGAVYRVQDLRLAGNLWAAKEMSDANIADPSEKQRAIAAYKRESQILATLNHLNIPRVIDSFQQGNKHYIVTEFVDGDTLNDLMSARGRPFTEAEMRSWLDQLCDALQYLHNCRPPIIYRDLKPQNIMLDRSGQIKLIDFGIARFFQLGKSKDTTLLGTPGYAPPEQHGQGQTDVRSDVFALGVTLHQLLTGYDPTLTPYNLPPVRSLAPGVSRDMELIIKRSLEFRPQDRWQTVTELQNALRRGAGPAPVLPAPVVTVGSASAAAPPQQMPYQASATRLPNRPTTRLLMKAATLSTQQLVAILCGILLLVAFGVWWLAPVIQRDLPFVWSNVPAFCIAGPLAYAAIRKPGAALLAQVLVTLVGWLAWWLRSGSSIPDYGTFFLATIASGFVAEAAMMCLSYVRGASGNDAWKREVVWFMLSSAAISITFYLIMYGAPSALRPAMWVGSALLGAAGWFIGDLVQQWIYLRHHGMRRLTRP